MVTLSVRYRESESPTTSNPGPIFAEVAGTVMVKERFDMAKDAEAILERREVISIERNSGLNPCPF